MANNYPVIFSNKEKILNYAKEHKLLSKLEKSTEYLKIDMRHGSLNVELMHPKEDGIYSFRVDKKYRGLFFINKKRQIEIFAITNHYK